jgi:hypothetical protein
MRPRDSINGLPCLALSYTSRSAFERDLLGKFDYILYWEFVLQVEDQLLFWFLLILCQFNPYFPLIPSLTDAEILCVIQSSWKL